MGSARCLGKLGDVVSCCVMMFHAWWVSCLVPCAPQNNHPPSPIITRRHSSLEFWRPGQLRRQLRHLRQLLPLSYCRDLCIVLGIQPSRHRIASLLQKYDRSPVVLGLSSNPCCGAFVVNFDFQGLSVHLSSGFAHLCFIKVLRALCVSGHVAACLVPMFCACWVSFLFLAFLKKHSP